ncbi:MAG: glycosyltransferase N-terminal domain-containing protein [Hydrotalea sp.]|nr:glycosyltransferase N-terminal domain-containing protein [Hydrotalea sp.]
MKKKYQPLLLFYYNLCLVVDVFLLLVWLVVGLTRWLLRAEGTAMIKERFGFWPHHRTLLRAIGTRKIIWLHAPSLGETRSVLPIISNLEKNHGDIFFIITCQSPSARLALASFLRDALPKNNFYLTLSPFDNLWLLKNKWRGLRPRFFFLAESDFLPRRALWLAVNRVPAVLLNGRMSKKSFFFFNFIMRWTWGRVIFRNLDAIWAQSSTAQNYLSRLSDKNIFYHGNLKLFKTADTPKKNLVAFYKQAIPADKQPLLFSCLHPGEEKMLLDLYKKFPELKKYFFAIIVPRHPTRAVWQKSFHLRAAAVGLTSRDFLLVSSFGHLASLYHLCPLVLLGGSWARRGGHNPKEALDQGCCLLHGPHVGNAVDIYTDTDGRRITFMVDGLDAIYKKIIWFKKLSSAEQQQFVSRTKKWQGNQRDNIATINNIIAPMVSRALRDD